MSAKREVCFILNKAEAIIYADISDSAIAIADSRKRWQVIWDNRDNIGEIAHSHPVSAALFSSEDETTMSALNSALGRQLRFSVIAPHGMRIREGENEQDVEQEPWWADLMRCASGMK